MTSTDAPTNRGGGMTVLFAVAVVVAGFAGFSGPATQAGVAAASASAEAPAPVNGVFPAWTAAR
ncbi:MAG TPA: hypothetical protein VGH99_19405 [Pseudonocardia sp.]|jgi:hypothetical protein